MSRISKWKLEKTKVKVVFRLQFHATHIPQTGWDKLFISFIPADSGKATAKTTKANVRNGTCKWGDPIYETTRLLQDSKTKQYDEKLYKLVVSMGSSRASTLGEATINLSDYADALKPSTAALPLQGCNFGTILHITVQLLTSKTGFREFEQQRELRERGLQSGVDGHCHSPTSKASFSEDGTIDQANKVRTKIKSKHNANDLTSFNDETNLNEESADSATGFDGSSQTSGSLYAEKYEASSTHEVDSLKGMISGDVFPNIKGDLSNQNMARWESDTSMDNEYATVCKENNRLRGSLELAESSIINLKTEIASLQILADELGVDSQKFSHLLASDFSSSEKLEKEISLMKSECQKLKEDLICLKESKVDNQANSLLQNVQLQFLNGISIVESKIRELQNNVHVVPETKFIYLELEGVLNFLLEFKIGNNEVNTAKEITEANLHKDEQFVSRNGLGSDLCPPVSILQHFSVNPVASEVNSLGTIDAMKAQIFDLVRELDEAKVEKEGLNRKMNQMECYYEALVQELEENQKRLLGELQHLRNEHSSCVYTLSSSRDEIESLREEMNQQSLQYEEERRDMEVHNKELEIRAATSEAALRRARLNYSIAVDKLQKDLELLSSQVMSMFETNENLIKQALPIMEIPEDDVQQSLQSGTKKRSVGGDVLLEDFKKSFTLQEELYQKVEQELIEMYSVNLNLDVYSNLLQESLREADDKIRISKEKMIELEAELKLSTASQNQLMEKLQKATDDIHDLNEFKSSSVSQCGEMALQNQLLKDKLVLISEENYLLSQKLKDCESEYRSYRTKYEDCLTQNEHHVNEMLVLKEKMSVLKSESDELASFKENLEESLGFVHDKLANLLESNSKHLHLGDSCQSLKLESVDMKDAALKLEKIQHIACSEIDRLNKENRNLLSEKDATEVSLSTARSEILVIRQKFKNDVQDMVNKLDMSNALVEKLQLELESMATKFHFVSEIEGKYMEQSKVLLADLALLEDQMQELTSNNGHFAQDILGLDALAEELGRNNLTVTKLIHDKNDLAKCLQDKTELSVKLSREVDELKEDLKILREENGKKDQVEAKVRELAAQLDRDQSKVVLFEQEKAELAKCLDSKSEESVKLSGEIDVLRSELKKLSDDLLEEKACKAELEAQVRDISTQLNKDQEKFLVLNQEKDELAKCLGSKSEESVNLLGEIEVLKGELKKLSNDLLEEKACKDELEAQVRDISTRLNGDQEKFHILEQEKTELAKSLDIKSEESAKLLGEIDVLKDELKVLSNDLLEEKACKGELEAQVRDISAQLNGDQEKFHILKQEKNELAMLLQGKSEESIKLAGEINTLKEKLKILLEELHEEKARRDALSTKVDGLTSQLSMEQEKLVSLELKNTEFIHSREITSNLELEKLRLVRLLREQDVFIEKAKANDTYHSNLENQLLEMCEYSLVADVKLIYLTNQYEARLEDLSQKLLLSEGCLRELQVRCRNTETALETYEVQNKLLSDSNNRKLTMMETNFSLNSVLQACELEWMKTIIVEAEEDIDLLTVLKEELEILVTVFKGKACELSTDATLVEAYKNEVVKLRVQCTELSHKLSEQVLKTEEFKNFSSHLKELKDKAEAECLLAHEKRETEVTPPPAANDSLRIAFMKEQYETKVQELKQLLSVSKKHGEEMLMKLQDAINEVENRKKSEAVSLKRNEELSVRLSALESELQSALAEKREKSNGYDRTKAELECALLSLECCKEEKEKLGASLLELEAENSQLLVDLSLAKEELEKHKSFEKIIKGEYGSGTEEKLEHSGSTGNSSPVFSDQDESTRGIRVASILDGQVAESTETMQLENVEDTLRLGSHPNSESNGKDLDVNKELLGVQSLRSSLEHLHQELEKMKSENIVFDGYPNADPSFQVPQKEIMQLHKANEELRSMYPLFNEISGDGNALERVLALEIELAESLKEKNKLGAPFQSSFLKQHSDEEAVFKSFRDINELINEMLELKGRHAAMESELREMHNRYSQLSLQFAEVEGERQKLKMTLKNVRLRKLASMNRTTSTDQSL